MQRVTWRVASNLGLFSVISLFLVTTVVAVAQASAASGGPQSNTVWGLVFAAAPLLTAVFAAIAAFAAWRSATEAKRAAESTHLGKLTNVRAHSNFDKAKAALEGVDTKKLCDNSAVSRRDDVREYMQLFTMIHFLLETKGIDNHLARSFVTLHEVCLLLGTVRTIVEEDRLDYDPRIFATFERLFRNQLNSSPV